jgi:tetratricopeptide (TPR) repeat protein
VNNLIENDTWPLPNPLGGFLAEVQALFEEESWCASNSHFGRRLRPRSPERTGRVMPGMAHIWVQLGHARKEVGHLREAEACYLAALDIDGRVADTYLQLGHVLKVEGRTEAARSAYARALELDDQCPSAADELRGLA